MYSYIDTHHLSPTIHYQPLSDLMPFIEQTLMDQNASSKIHFEVMTETSFKIDHFNEMIQRES